MAAKAYLMAGKTVFRGALRPTGRPGGYSARISLERHMPVLLVIAGKEAGMAKGWPKGVPFSEEHKEAIRQAHLERSRIIAAVLEQERPDPKEEEEEQ